MITKYKNLIYKNPEWLRRDNPTLTFMKMSTPSSGTKSERGKVIIFVFEDDEFIPSICIKTSRTYLGRDEIFRNYENLKLLKEGLKGDLSSEMFVRPLYFYDDGTNVFCVESVAPGIMFSAQNRGVELVVEKYTEWQINLASSTKKVMNYNDLRLIAIDSIKRLSLSESSSKLLFEYYDNLSLDSTVALPEIVQHGDMTPDNVFVHKNSIYLIDYDCVGVSFIPGFDLFNFLLKHKGSNYNFRAVCKNYFPIFFSKFGFVTKSYDAIFFIYYLQESVRKGVGQKNSSAEIIADFEKLLSRSL